MSFLSFFLSFFFFFFFGGGGGGGGGGGRGDGQTVKGDLEVPREILDFFHLLSAYN